jgi:hypothetical protein
MAKEKRPMPDYRLGKKPAKIDARTFQLAPLLKELPPIPTAWSWDAAHPGFSIPTPMFANDYLGDCVIAGRAHQTLRFEAFEQNKVIVIRDKDVTREYFLESGGIDSGLVMLDAMNAWRQRGWRIGCCLSRPYKVYAFAQVNPKEVDMLQAAIYLLSGIQTGILLPLSAQNQTGPDGVWDVGGPAGEWGGHAVFIEGR